MFLGVQSSILPQKCVIVTFAWFATKARVQPVKCAPSNSYVPPTMVVVVVRLKDRASKRPKNQPIFLEIESRDPIQYFDKTPLQLQPWQSGPDHGSKSIPYPTCSKKARLWSGLSTMCTQRTVYTKCTVTYRVKWTQHLMHPRMMHNAHIMSCLYVCFSFSTICSCQNGFLADFILPCNKKDFKTDPWLGSIDTIWELVVRDIDGNW